jgi:hypothetical protein
MQPTSDQAREDLWELDWKSPTVTMIDGAGNIRATRHGSPDDIRDYTLNGQVTTPFNLSLCIRTALRTTAPDVIILPGPGSNLGSAVAQVLISETWAGIRDRESFIARQNEDPILLSMRWPDQRKLVVNT